VESTEGKRILEQGRVFAERKRTNPGHHTSAFTGNRVTIEPRAKNTADLLKKYRDKAVRTTNVKSANKAGYASLDDDEDESKFGIGSSSKNEEVEIKKGLFGDIFKKK
jgi:hypothetical protein